MDDQPLRTRVKESIGALTSSGVPAPSFRELTASSTPVRPRRRGAVLAVAALVAVAAFAGVIAVVRSQESGGGSVASCGEAVGIDGRIYQRDSFNDDAVPVEALGDVVGVVEEQWTCDDTGPDRTIPAEGIVASLLSPGTELRSIGTGPASSTVAAVLDGRVIVYQASDVDRFSFTADVSEIGINSEYDGTTRFATIDDQSTISVLMDAARSSPQTDRRDDDTDLDDRQYFVELVRTDGLRTVIPYWIDEAILGDRTVPDTWSTSVENALAQSPDQPIVDYIALAGDGVAGFHLNGGCRRDRPDLVVAPNDTLTFVIDPALQLSFVFVTSRPLDPTSGEPADAFAPDVAPTFEVPANESALIVEATLTGADGATIGTCTSLRVAAEP